MRKHIAGLLVGLAAAALVLTVDRIGAATAGPSRTGPLQTIELKTYDWRLARTARPDQARQDIALVEIDEASIRKLERLGVGRWPWPRAVHSLVVDYLARAPAKLVVYDIDFAEADTRRGFDFGDSTWSGAESDKAFVDSVRAAGNVILPADATYDATAAAPSSEFGEIPDEGFGLSGAGFLERKVVFPPFASLAGSAAGLGHNLFALDPDGPIRHTIPFVKTGNRVLPSLGLAAAMRAAGIAPADVSIDPARPDRLRIGSREMPLEWRRIDTSAGPERFSWGLVNFRGPAAGGDLKTPTYPTYSFFDLEQSEEKILAKAVPDIAPSVFRDKIVFVGTTATGLFDVYETPFSSGKMPGIQVHAAVADDVLSNRFIRPPGVAVRIGSVVAAGLLIGVLATTLPAWWGLVTTAVSVALFGWLAVALFASGWWINLTQPVLAASFALLGGVSRQYFVEGREKRRMKKLFGQYVSRDVYSQLVANPELARLGGQRREMTVVFADIRGFTTLSEGGRPEEIVSMLNEYFTRMVTVVFRHKGTIDKFVGDMVMALFGAPLDDPDHADHAAQAALDMIEEVRRLNEEWKAQGRFAGLEIGVGISTGPMIAGNIGSDAIMSYTVIGDAVNLGARLESLNKEYGTRIIISDGTRAELKRSYTTRPLGHVVARGKTESVEIHELVGRGEPAVARLSVPEVRT